MAFGWKQQKAGPYGDRMVTAKMNCLAIPSLTGNGQTAVQDDLKGTFWVASGVFNYYDSSGVAQTIASGATSTTNDATTNAVTDVLVLTHSTTGTAAAGIGTGISIKSEDASGNVQEIASIDGVLTTATHGSEDGDVVVSAILNGTITQALLIDASDQSLTIGQNATDADNIDKLRIFSQTINSGSLMFQATANSGNTVVSVTNAAHGQATALTIPDCGTAAGSFALSNSANTVKFIAAANSTITVPTTVSITGNMSVGGAFTTAAAVTFAGVGTPTLTLVGNLTTAANVIFAGANAIQFTTVGAYTYTLPASSGTLALATGAETGTTSSSFTVDSDSAVGKFALATNTAGTNHTVTLKAPVTTQAVTLTLPDVAADTVAVLGAAQTFAAATLTAPVVNGMTTAAAANNFTLNTGSGAITTTSGAFTFYSSAIANNGNATFTWTSSGAWDMSGATCTFKTPTDTNTLGGNVVISGTKTLTTGTGDAVLKGSATFDTTKTLTFGSGTAGTAEPILMYSATSTNGSFAIACCNGATNSKTTLTNVNCAAAAVISLPNATSTLATIGLAESFSGVKTFTAAPIVAIDAAAGVTTVATLTKTNNGGVGANDDGLKLSVIVENATNATTEVANLQFVNTTAALATADTDIVFSTMLAGTVTEAIRVNAASQALVIGRNAADANGLYRLQVYPVTNAKGSVILSATAHASADRTTTITNATDSGANVVVTLPNTTGTLATLGVAETFSAVKTFSAAPIISVADAGTNAVLDVLRIGHTTSGVEAAGFGVGMTFYIEDAGGSEEHGSMDVVLDVVTDGSEDASMIFSQTLNSVVCQTLKVDGTNHTLVVGENASNAHGIHSVTIRPVTAAKGALILDSIANTNDVTVTVRNAASAAARIYTFGDAGADKYVAYAAAATGAIARSDITEEALATVAIIPIGSMIAADGAPLGIVETAGDHYAVLAANVYSWRGEEASNETEVSVSYAQFALPENYVAGGDVTVRIRCKIDGAGTNNGSTIDVEAYEQADGAVGADIQSTAAATFAAKSTWYSKDFAITATDLVAGDVVTLKITSTVIESATAAFAFYAEPVKVLCDVKA